MNIEFSIVLTLTIHAIGANFNNCYYQYNHECYEDRVQHLHNMVCNLDNIPETKLALGSDGKLKVQLNLPNIDCEYNVALLANPSVKSNEECQKHVFSESGNIHTTDRTICVSASEKNEKYQSHVSCHNDNITLEFEYIFTGCYALRFSINNKNYYVIKSNQFFETSYQLSNVLEPEFHCSFDNRENKDSSNVVTFISGISMPSISPRISLQLRSMSLKYENEANACNLKAKNTPYEWDINLNGCGREVKNCNFMVIHNNSIVSNGVYKGDIECSFLLPVPFNASYCFFMILDDERCSRDTIWNPPPTDSNHPPCVWMKQCRRIMKPRSIIVYPDPLQDDKKLTSDSILLVPIVTGLILLFIVICGIIFSIYRWQLFSEQAYLNANLRELKVIQNSECDGLDIDRESKKIENYSIDKKSRAIVLLYARGSPSFMGFMSEFREILKQYCCCHVHDWYAPCEWNAVAKVGACDWAANLFKKNHRAVWIDTPAARSLMNEKYCNEYGFNEEAISDFRDMAFPAVLGCAKRYIVNPKLQYNQHFVVRLEGVNTNLLEDSFADLSPHARYLIPYHLNQLFSHLSSRKSDARDNGLVMEEVRMRERLMNIKNDI